MKGADRPLPGATAEVGEGKAEPTLDALLSDVADIVRGPIGTVRLFRLGVEADGDACADTGRGTSSSGGVSSAAGIGRPRAAAMI